MVPISPTRAFGAHSAYLNSGRSYDNHIKRMDQKSLDRLWAWFAEPVEYFRKSIYFLLSLASLV